MTSLPGLPIVLLLLVSFFCSSLLFVVCFLCPFWDIRPGARERLRERERKRYTADLLGTTIVILTSFEHNNTHTRNKSLLQLYICADTGGK